MSSTTSAGPSAAPGLYTRKATGLVREGRTVDALFYNVMWSSVALTFAFFWLLYSFFYSGSNAFLAFLIAAGLGSPGRSSTRCWPRSCLAPEAITSSTAEPCTQRLGSPRTPATASG